jgi:uncharacterized membrane protein YraQ (UPF0718 family)
LTALLYATTALFAPGLTLEALAFFTRTLGRTMPVLAAVFALLLSLDLFLSPVRVRRMLGEQSGLRGWAAALAGGILATGPVYAWYALVGELRTQGMRTSLAAAFLYARAVKLPLLPLLIHYFGLRFTLVLSVYLVAFAILSGMLMGRLDPAGSHASAGGGPRSDG